MRKKLLLSAILVASLGMGLVLPVAETAALPATEFFGVTPADPDTDPDDGGDPDGTPEEGYDACNNVLPGGSTPPGFCDKKGENDLIAVVGRVLNAVYFWLGILAVVFIIIGGVNYTTSQGDPGKIAKAKSTIMYAIIGLVVALLAFAITQFVLNALKGA